MNHKLFSSVLSAMLLTTMLFAPLTAFAKSENEDRVGSETGTGSNRGEACGRAKNSASLAASLAKVPTVLGSSSISIGECDCGEEARNHGSSHWTCSVEWKVHIEYKD